MPNRELFFFFGVLVDEKPSNDIKNECNMQSSNLFSDYFRKFLKIQSSYWVPKKSTKKNSIDHIRKWNWQDDTSIACVTHIPTKTVFSRKAKK